MNPTNWKKFAISSLAVMTLMSGASTAFAKDHGDRHGNDSGQHDDKDKGGKNDDKNKNEVTININFSDEEDMKWATEYIVRLASKGVFTGYEDGSFKPAQKISRIETIVAAVRLMGLREQAESAAEMSTDLNFKDADQLKKKYPWAVGYVAVALENDLFSETEDSIQPEKPATRLWSATILVKALKLDAEAKAKVNTKLSFKDAKQIPAGSVGYVAVALDKGIVTGYNDNTFRPNQQVTRAELAALLDRTDSQLPDHDAQAITGSLKAAAANGAITVVKADKTEVALTLDPNVFIFRDNKKATVADLKAGDEVLVRTYQNKVIFIEVTKLAAQPTVTVESGTLNSYSLNAQGKIATISIMKVVNGATQATIFNVDANVAITGDFAKLVAGNPVDLTVENNVVKLIVIK
ncbi:S-layer homology domain-containing protein [Paenibacillus sp. MMS18-CY102]|uniref:S-layer homology domain-containing protein n=1 Tax=Paenibacillus sp. MMS18-CY102 TaxID=2682849 RepID=UPI0013667722|nr:S-layer homology domain-containing protein [Paenibacillus sp. MMS18-CY102]MWC28955.1 S-layer homology domain-containing protein [Paenibacillus sp. MMS18-CY102]